MNDNLFKGAKFGDKFVTRDGRISILVSKEQYRFAFVIEGLEEVIPFFIDGISMDGNYAIVSRYQESIDEDKLNELASEWCKNNVDINEDGWAEYDGNEAYKAGYRKAKEE